MDAIRAFVQTLLPFEFMQFDFMVNALLAILLLTPLLGLLGTMAVNQQMAFFSDALGHSALTGIGLGILLGVSSDLLAMLVFGIVWALLICRSKTVLIGRNGSGKSTLISLLLQLYQPTGGKITLNGIDISEFVLREYRNMVSVVSQEIYLFNSSIRDNICMYKNIDDKTIMEACKDSGLADFISEVSLDYVVGQNGAMLSGGQKQKIALARALVHNSPVIIFDEATSNTDVYSEHQINGLLHTKLKEKTVIIITHKQEILKEADQIIMLKDGAVVGSGVYDDLSKDNLEFKNMLKMGEKY